MRIPLRAGAALLLASLPFAGAAAETANCFTNEVEAHVIEQFAAFGPRSRDREYFGFIYRHDGVIASATTSGLKCRWPNDCLVITRHAAVRIPRGAKVLGEWHTHPHDSGANALSPEDVRGANDNRHIRCYRAFFSTSDGDILAWDPNASAVAVAMSTWTLLGNYREAAVGTPRWVAHSN